MLSAVSGVSFRGQQQAAVQAGNSAEDFQKLIQSEGKFTTKPNTENAGIQPAADAPAKKGKAGKIIGGIIGAIVIAGLALFGLKKGNVLKIDPEAKGVGKFTSKLAEIGNWIDEKMVTPVLNLFKGKGAKDVADAATDAAADTAKAGEQAAEDTAKAIFA